MKGKLQQKRILLAKRLFMAESSMHQAAELARFTKSENIGRRPDVFAPIMAGICVVYARPFLRADGLGPLNEKYARFDEPKLQDTHNDLIRNRHHFYAHRDFLKTRALEPISGTLRDMHTVRLFFDGKGFYTAATQEPMYRDINLPDIIRLADFPAAAHRGRAPQSYRQAKSRTDLTGRELRTWQRLSSETMRSNHAMANRRPPSVYTLHD